MLLHISISCCFFFYFGFWKCIEKNCVTFFCNFESFVTFPKFQTIVNPSTFLQNIQNFSIRKYYSATKVPQYPSLNETVLTTTKHTKETHNTHTHTHGFHRRLLPFIFFAGHVWKCWKHWSCRPSALRKTSSIIQEKDPQLQAVGPQQAARPLIWTHFLRGGLSVCALCACVCACVCVATDTRESWRTEGSKEWCGRYIDEERSCDSKQGRKEDDNMCEKQIWWLTCESESCRGVTLNIIKGLMWTYDEVQLLI